MDIADIIGTVPEKTEDRFVVQTQEHALWASGKMRKAEERLQQLQAMRDEYKRRIDEWFEHEAAEPRRTVDAMAEMLRPYVADQVARGTKRSIQLPDGTKAGFRATPESINDTDPEATVEWCEQFAPEAVKKSVQKSVLKKRLKSGEALPPSVDIEPGEDRFYVSVKEGSDA